MFEGLRRFLRYAVGYRTITVESESAHKLILSCWPTRTVFDSKKGQISQNGIALAALSAIERVEVHQPPNQDSTVNWYLTIHMKSVVNPIQVGQTTDPVEASIIAARISSFTGRPVTARV